jgi:uncharacterized membrane protein (DUF485 family)
MADPADDETDSSLPSDGEADADSLIGRVKDLADDARTAAEAEIAWQSARAGFVGKRAAFIAAWSGFALVCAFVAVLALAFGAILALTPLIGAILATAVVTGVLLLAAVIAGLIARNRVRQLKAAAFPVKPGARP